MCVLQIQCEYVRFGEVVRVGKMRYMALIIDMNSVLVATMVTTWSPYMQ